jgi:hypothetical protein
LNWCEEKRFFRTKGASTLQLGRPNELEGYQSSHFDIFFTLSFFAVSFQLSRDRFAFNISEPSTTLWHVATAENSSTNHGTIACFSLISWGGFVKAAAGGPSCGPKWKCEQPLSGLDPSVACAVVAK